jgi:iron(III) transport system ATP-binding protein
MGIGQSAIGIRSPSVYNPRSTMTSIELRHIGKRFDSTLALEDVNLRIAPGELLFLLGPSGCGKSTLLRIVAGLLEPGGGSILFDGSDVTGLGTQQRNAVMCFQNYALWPHMTVRQNVEFGLSVRGGEADERSARVDQALRLVQLEAYAQRKPNALSGGQQQRAALARALVVAPKCLLLDEPLSNLDAKLRLEMRSGLHHARSRSHHHWPGGDQRNSGQQRDRDRQRHRHHALSRRHDHQQRNPLRHERRISLCQQL